MRVGTGRAGAGGCIDFEKSTHIGIRGISSGPGLQEKSDKLGYRTITMDEFDKIGAEGAASLTKERIGDDPCVIILVSSMLARSCLSTRRCA